ncbi:hypothetical protein CcCBS67573_g04323 [Chytriomyces confervae]|uniref:Nucleotidyl transferase domain-containing protein n=1 Tax=Chytriomyces confervae TaxID=246404 RepID=A0A507FGK5_9FUNG|nr:hypothetical protein CcCBS67573_g04323 [Chytriomyces confervae]
MDKIAVLFLAAGYGSRLQRDINNDASGRFSHLKGVAKALLPLDGVPLISHWQRLLTSSSAADVDSFVICNEANYPQFKEWASSNSFPVENIFNDGSTANETRLGAVTDLALAIQKFDLARLDVSSGRAVYKAVLVIAGDTLFLKDFSLDAFLKLALSAKPIGKEPCFVTSYPVENEMDTLKTGIIETTDQDLFKFDTITVPRVTGLVEKPHPTETTSRLACPCFYFLSHPSLGLVKAFVDASLERGEGLESRDASGRFISALVKQHPVYAVPVSGRLDIGGLSSFISAEEYLQQAKKA